MLKAAHSVRAEVDRPKEDAMAQEYVNFFMEKTVQILQSKGKNTDTVVLPMTQERLERQLYMEYPELVRKFNTRCMPAPAKPDQTLTKLQTDVLAATWMKEQQDFSLATEQRERGLVYDLRHHRLLAERRSVTVKPGVDSSVREGLLLTASGSAGPAFRSGKLPSGRTTDTFKPKEWEMRPW